MPFSLMSCATVSTTKRSRTWYAERIRARASGSDRKRDVLTTYRQQTKFDQVFSLLRHSSTNSLTHSTLA